MVEAAQLEQLTTGDVLSLAVALHRGVIEREAMKLAVAADWADRHCPAAADPDLATRDSDGKVIPGADRARLFGGDGTPEVMEFAPAELGVAYEMSRWQANRLIADALDLRHRLPRLWARVLAGEVPAWKACKIAAATRHLSKEAAAQVDADTCEPVSRESWSRFCDILTGRIIAADPDLAQALADKAARARYVRTGRTNQHGLKSIHAQLPQGDVLRIMAQVKRLAKVMGAMGDEDSPDERRAKAMALLCEPDETLALIAASEGIDLSDVDVDDDNSGLMGGEDDGHYMPNNGKTYTPEDDYDVPPDPDLDPDPDGPVADAESTGDDDDDHAAAPTDESAEDRRRDRDGSDRENAAARQGSSARPRADVEGGCSDPAGSDAAQENSAQSETTEDMGAGGDDHDRTSGPDYTSNQSGEEGVGPGGEGERPPHDQARRENSAHWRLAGRHGTGRGLSPKVAREMLKVIAQSGLDPARIGPQIVLYHHFAHESMTDGNGTVRLEGAGAMTLQELRNFLDPFSRITVKPVIDLNARQMPVDGYETPVRLREQLHLRWPGDAYPWSSYTGRRVQMDHTIAYIPLEKGGRAGQTWLGGLAPLVAFSHRVKTHGGTRVRQPRPGTLVWRTRHGLVVITDHTGTHNLGTDAFAQAIWRAACAVNGEVLGNTETDDPPPHQEPATATDEDRMPALDRMALAFYTKISAPPPSPLERNRPVWKLMTHQKRLIW